MEDGKRGIRVGRAVFICIGAAIIVLMFLRIGIKEFYDNLTGANISYIAYGFAIFVVAGILKCVRWWGLFKEIGFIDSSKVYLIGQAVNQIAPTGSGELARAYIARRNFGIRTGNTLAPAAIERLFDTGFMVGLTLIFLTLLVPPMGHIYQISFAIGVGVASLGAILYLVIRPQFLTRLIQFPLRFFKQGSFLYKACKRAEQSVDVFQSALLRFHDKKALLIQTLALTVLTWILYGIASFYILKALGSDINWLYLAPIVCASEVIGAFSFIPGGLGAKELSFAYLLFLLDVPLLIGESAALIIRGISYIIMIASGGLSMVTLPERRESSLMKQSDERSQPKSSK